MKKFYIRLDDACENVNFSNWDRMEKLLDKYKIKPLIGVIPNCEDPAILKYDKYDDFWIKIIELKNKGWEIAMHGYNHVYSSDKGGINPVNSRSEFAGLSYDEQSNKIKSGIDILNSHDIFPKVFFAPSHTFDINTIYALLNNSNIRVISDTIAYKSYMKYGITFVPQQSGKVRNVFFKEATFCYHPNTMSDSDFQYLEKFLNKYQRYFCEFPIHDTNRKFNLLDFILKKIYFIKRRLIKK